MRTTGDANFLLTGGVKIINNYLNTQEEKQKRIGIRIKAEGGGGGQMKARKLLDFQRFH